MEREKLVPYIERLKAAQDGKARNAIVAEFCKEFKMKLGDAWKLLKEAGYESEASKAITPQTESNSAANSGAEGGASEGGNNLLDSAANNPNAFTDDAPPAGENTPPIVENPAEQKVKVKLRHKTKYPKYRRASLVIDQRDAEFGLTEEQLAALRKDVWVVIDGKDFKERSVK